MSPLASSSNSESLPVVRILIIRLSSFGDIVQALSAPAALRQRFPGCEIDWLVRSDFVSLVSPHPLIDRTFAFDRKRGLVGLIVLAWTLAGTGYTNIYDAHCNFRSRVIKVIFVLRALGSFRFPKILTRSKNRIRRLLFFRFRLPVLPVPFRGAESFLRPLKAWGVKDRAPLAPQFYTEAVLPIEIKNELEALRRPLVALAASAAWPMKRWPLEHWAELIARWESARFVLLGGPEDLFLNELAKIAPARVINLAGRLSLAQSCALLQKVDLVIANDTGLLHVADQMGRPTLALIGPTAFGYPSQPTSVTMEVALSCKPCSKDGRGGCVNSVYQRCLKEITPDAVIISANALLKENRANEIEAEEKR